MSEVALSIGGRIYRVACAAGEEERVERLGATIAEKLDSMGNPSGPDAQNLLFAALLLADEALEGREATAAAGAASGERARFETAIADLEDRLSGVGAERDELKTGLAEAEAETVRLQGALADFEAERSASAAVSDAQPAAADLGALAPALEHFAEMLEECADKLEARARAS